MRQNDRRRDLRHARACPGHPRASTWRQDEPGHDDWGQCAMTLPDGYSDVPAGKIAAVVTHLEMTERPALSPASPGPWTLRKVERPELAWYRDLYRRVGEE